jgi:hypothetical protein
VETRRILTRKHSKSTSTWALLADPQAGWPARCTVWCHAPAPCLVRIRMLLKRKPLRLKMECRAGRHLPKTIHVVGPLQEPPTPLRQGDHRVLRRNHSTTHTPPPTRPTKFFLQSQPGWGGRNRRRRQVPLPPPSALQHTPKTPKIRRHPLRRRNPKRSKPHRSGYVQITRNDSSRVSF